MLPDSVAKSTLLSQYKHSAKRRGLLWELTDDQFFALTIQNCHYCEVPPSNVKKLTRKSGLTLDMEYTYNGIDRVDNAIGYLPSNCVPCCDICNKAKRNMSLDMFMAWLHRTHSRIPNGRIPKPICSQEPPGGES